MAKKVFYWISGSLLALSLLFLTAGAFLNPQQVGYALTGWTMATVFILRPVFYEALGAICAVKLFPAVSRRPLRLFLLILGVCLTLLLFGIAAAELLGHPAVSGILGLFRLLFRAPGYFLIPGALVGFGLFAS